MRVHRTAAAGVLLTAAFSLGFTGTAGADDLNCSDFATQADAQAVYDATPGDPNGLDQNGNGIACETLPTTDGSPAVTEDSTALAGQAAPTPTGGVAAGDGSSAEDGSPLPYVLSGLAFLGAGGAAVAARRSSRSA